jgi:2-C-methyl-D-erythritol 4-phosphate cytidylyltransferase/2-C-methyl-D-erythritol 2,4-cyclodiphosphate synthase
MGRRVWAVVPAAGRGARFESTAVNGPKQYAPLAGATVLEWSLAALLKEPRVSGIVVALAAADTRWPALAAAAPLAKIETTIGGASRQESVMSGLKALMGRADADDWVLVHDAARPCLTSADLTALIDAVEGHDAGIVNGAVLAAPIHDTVKRERDGIAVDTVDRSGLWRALTPQLFGYARLVQALDDVVSLGIAVTDEAQAMERLGLPPRLVCGSSFNIKVTTAADLDLAEAILRGAENAVTAHRTTEPHRPEAAHRPAATHRSTEHNPMRIGQGFDVHAFGAGDHVILGGVRIDYPRGVIAHSDGDVVIHALCDALLGALGAGDIGQHFPDTDPRYRNADSRVFLREVAARMRAAGLKLVNADVTVLAEAPRIARYRTAMAENLAADLGVAARCINIKATTTERLGFIGRGEGLAASAAVLLDAASLDADKTPAAQSS